MNRQLFGALLLVLSLAPVAHAQQPPPQPQDEFVPVSELPPQDQLPSAPLLIGAYAFVWLALGGYVLSVARRLNTVQRELERLDTDVKKGSRA
jgi:CcmD family protein